jgi:hypothetical protein
MRVPAIAFALVFVGCVDKGDEGLFILNNTAPTGTTCALTGDSGQPFLAHGRIVQNSPEGYLITPLIQSRIDSLVGHEAERTVHLEGANVTLSSVDSTGNLGSSSSFTALFSGSVGPLDTVNVGFEVLPASMTATLGEYNANITVFGTLGGGRIDGEPFDYPITVCTNCILHDLGACTMSTSTMNIGNPCNAFQDGVVDCCTFNGAQICPAAPM